MPAEFRRVEFEIADLVGIRVCSILTRALRSFQYSAEACHAIDGHKRGHHDDAIRGLSITWNLVLRSLAGTCPCSPRHPELNFKVRHMAIWPLTMLGAR